MLVRPDKHVGWRSTGLPDDPVAALRAAMMSLLSRLWLAGGGLWLAGGGL